VKISDFGMADFHDVSASWTTSASAISYVPPELLLEAPGDDTKVDIWAMGVILFALLCGRLPFGGSDLSYMCLPEPPVIESRIIEGVYKIDGRLSKGAKELLTQLLAADAASRPSAPDVLGSPWLSSSAESTDAARRNSSGDLTDVLDKALALQSPDIVGEVHSAGETTGVGAAESVTGSDTRYFNSKQCSYVLSCGTLLNWKC
jgi:serine/threonine protein kinase